MSYLSYLVFTKLENGYSIGDQTEIPSNGISIDPSKVFTINVPKYYNNIKVVELGKHCFSSLPSLKTLLIPNTIHCFRYDAIWNCTKLISIDFEENSQLEYIERGAFDRCESLISVILPPSLISLGTFSFCRCYSLKTIIYCGTAGFDSSILDGAWSQVTQDISIYVKSSYPLDNFITKPVIKDDKIFENAHFFYATQKLTCSNNHVFLKIKILILIIIIL